MKSMPGPMAFALTCVVGTVFTTLMIVGLL